MHHGHLNNVGDKDKTLGFGHARLRVVCRICVQDAFLIVLQILCL